MAYAYDISSYNDSGTSGTYFSKLGFTGGDTQASYTFAVSSSYPLAGNSFQASLPVYYQASSLSQMTCSLTISTDGVKKTINGLITTPFWEQSGPNFVQCKFPTDLDVTLKSTQQLELNFDGLQTVATGIADAIDLPTSCRASVSPIEDWGLPTIDEIAANPFALLLLPFKLVANIPDIISLDAGACCSDIFLQVFGAGDSIIDRGFADFCSLFTMPETGLGCVENCPAESIRLTSNRLAASSNRANVKADISSTFRTAEKLLAISPQASGTVLANNEPVPGYIWVRLPKYRVSQSNITGLNTASGTLNAQDYGITCKLSHTFLGESFTHPLTTYVSSPQTLIRPIDANDLSKGVIVQCALGLDIPAGSNVKADISGLYTPLYETTCGRFGLISNSAECCNGYSVEYRYGNALQSTIKFKSLGSESCPNYFEDDASLVAASERIISNVQFSPSSGVAVDQTVAVPYIQFYVSQQPAVVAGVQPEYHIYLPGFAYPNYASLPAGLTAGYKLIDENLIRVQTRGGIIYPTHAEVKVDGGNRVLHFKLNGLHFDAEQIVQIFFPELNTTDTLPTTSKCRGSAAGIPSQDDSCCAEFRVEMRISGVSYFYHSGSCPVIQSSENNTSDAFWTCSSEDTFSLQRCCMNPNLYNFDTIPEFNERCLEYRCSDPASPLFDAELCCSNALYSNNAICCSGSWFCPQQCCGQYLPAFPDPITGNEVPARTGFFNIAKCCAVNDGVTTPDSDDDYQFNWDGSSIHKICSCHNDMNDQNWVDFAEKNCCEPVNESTANGAVVALPPVCACEKLYSSLANATTPLPDDIDVSNSTVNPLIKTAINEQQSIINSWLIENPSLSTQYCCVYSTSQPDVFENSNTLMKYCDCKSGKLVPGIGYDKDCCLYSELTNWCVEPPTEENEVPEPCGCGTCGCGCKSNVNAGTGVNGSCCKKQQVEIADIASGADTIITINKQPNRTTDDSSSTPAIGSGDVVDTTTTTGDEL
jgi:hypothetical protein